VKARFVWFSGNRREKLMFYARYGDEPCLHPVSGVIFFGSAGKGQKATLSFTKWRPKTMNKK
jgi:hypothetical protein